MKKENQKEKESVKLLSSTSNSLSSETDKKPYKSGMHTDFSLIFTYLI